MSLNRSTIMGRLVRDPELRKTQTGRAVVSFTLAVDRDFTNKETGERETDFIDVVAWGRTAEFVDQYFQKGRMAIADGRLQIRGWEDNAGNKRRSAEIIAENVYFGDSKKDASPPRSNTTTAAGSTSPSYAQAEFEEIYEDDGLPF